MDGHVQLAWYRMEFVFAMARQADFAVLACLRTDGGAIPHRIGSVAVGVLFSVPLISRMALFSSMSTMPVLWLPSHAGEQYSAGA